ncbi:hypothetical protein DPM19_03645 [Actinomadura craniellae]|uniref:Uncharacterized protein n=1 Tax=Actinomadura craniellae TaxID=2231787 RepID=A0A365HDP6_9ACTN|nr:hypothetical protein [Actinomadura craniellae]RAY17250.1 hypothetical protein DPM19_03645 [Actinomadura craniellae]
MTDIRPDLAEPRRVARPGTRGRAVVRFAVGVLAGLVLAGALAVADGGMNRVRVLERTSQPASVRYPDGATHHLGLVEKRSWVFGRHRAYQLVAGRDPSLSYGHAVEVGFTGSTPKIQGTRWEPTGVLVRFNSGHEVHIPARYFMNGR